MCIWREVSVMTFWFITQWPQLLLKIDKLRLNIFMPKQTNGMQYFYNFLFNINKLSINDKIAQLKNKNWTSNDIVEIDLKKFPRNGQERRFNFTDIFSYDLTQEKQFHAATEKHHKTTAKKCCWHSTVSLNLLFYQKKNCPFIFKAKSRTAKN